MKIKFILSVALAFDASQSTISGVTSGDILIINQTYTLTVQARDSSGIILTTSGENIYLRISDPCTRGPNMACVPSAFTQSAANGVVQDLRLTDNTDGTYSVSFSLNHIGDATLSVLHIDRQGVIGEYYNSGSISGTPDVTNTSETIDFRWGVGDITPGYPEAAAKFTGKLTPFKTGEFTCTLEQDDGATVRLDGTNYLSKYGEAIAGFYSFSYNFTALRTYDIEIDWKDGGLGATLVLYWDLGSGNQVIPSDNYGVTTDVETNPLQVSVACPDKYEQIPSTTNQCRPICGDGFVVDTEVCDDGNTADGDGCSSDCSSIETNWACSGGSTSSRSVCTECTQGLYQNDPSNPTECITKCSDGYRAGSEACDDGNTSDGDGCASDCSKVEVAWRCDTSVPNICVRDYKSVPMTTSEKGIQIGTLSITPIVVGLNIIRGYLSSTSTNSIFSSVNQLQLLILFLLCEISLPIKIVTYLRTLTASLIDINIDWSFFIVFKKIIEWLDYPQDRNDFDTIDISSGSSLLNLNTLIGSFFLYIIIYIMLWATKACVGKSK